MKNIREKFISIITPLQSQPDGQKNKKRAGVSQPATTESTKARPNFIEMDPPDTRIYNPNSYPCFHEHAVMADPDHCTVWDCLEQIAQCGGTGYIMQMRQFICFDIAATFDQFYPGGKAFLRCLQNVTTTEHINLFRDQIKPCCGRLQAYGASMERAASWVNCNFCDIFVENRAPFGLLFSQSSDSDTVNAQMVYDNVCPHKL